MQVVECLPSKWEALSSNLNTTNFKKGKKYLQSIFIESKTEINSVQNPNNLFYGIVNIWIDYNIQVSCPHHQKHK
jgi:hypothetical protein